MKSKWIWAGACAVLLAACAPKSGSEGLTKSGLDPSKFETTVDGKAVKLYVLKNKAGMEVCATNYGGRIVSVMVPDATTSGAMWCWVTTPLPIISISTETSGP